MRRITKTRSIARAAAKPTEPLNYMEGLRLRRELELHFTPYCRAQARAMLQRGDRVSDVAEFMSVKEATIKALKKSKRSRDEALCRVRLPTAPKHLSPKSVDEISSALRSAQRELDKVKQLLKESEDA